MKFHHKNFSTINNIFFSSQLPRDLHRLHREGGHGRRRLSHFRHCLQHQKTSVNVIVKLYLRTKKFRYYLLHHLQKEITKRELNNLAAFPML